MRKLTTFDPNRHGWPFVNTFTTQIGPIVFGGLCGGMALGAADAFAHGIDIPRQPTDAPKDGPLHKYIFDRQLNAHELMDADFLWQIAGTDSQYKRWSDGALGGGNFEGLRQSIDANKPVPIGLVNPYVGIPGGGESHHQVLGVGYEVVGTNREDVRIHIYDPNHPNEILILVPIEGTGPPADRHGRSDYHRYVPSRDGTVNEGSIVNTDPFWGVYFPKAYNPRPPYGYDPGTCALLASNGKFVSPQGGGGGPIMVDGPAATGPWERLRVEALGAGKIALKAPNGQYFSPQGGGGGEVRADGPTVGAWEPLEVANVGAGQVAFRTVTGHFVSRETVDGGRLLADKIWRDEWETFSISFTE